MIKSRLYLYDSSKSDFKGEDYSRYVLLGDTVKDDLTEVMGTIELTLAGVPSRKNDEIKTEEFTPETLFVYERADVDENGNDVYSEHWDMCVQNDTVSQPILSDDNYFDHHITLIEASAIAQKRLVDNIAVTYRLQDVTLEGQLNIDTDMIAEQQFNVVTGKHLGTVNQWLMDNTGHADINLGKKIVWEFADWFPSGNPCRGEKKEWEEFKYYQPIPIGQSTAIINLPTPMARIFNGVEGASDDQFYELGYCSVRTIVTEIDGNNSTVISDFVTNPYGANDNSSHEKWAGDWADRELGAGSIVNSATFYSAGSALPIWGITKTPIQIANYENTPDPQTRRIIFEVKPNCRYTVVVTLQTNFNYEYNAEAWQEFLVKRYSTPKYSETSNGSVCASLEFMTYQQGENAKVQISSAPQQNAYELFQKAQLTTQDTNKTENIAINETPMTFFVNNNDKLKLSNTRIVENFYNQKNLWELLIELGKYIHSIPKVVFGENNRFQVVWQKLGSTEQFEDNATKISIFNSRDVENYISACSSYIANMVQLGGVIDEWVAPKSSSEDYLVYNDVAEIITNKPIIEIVSMEAKCITSGKYQSTNGVDITTINGGIASLTPSTGNGYIFEEAVYNVLDITASSLVNKGLAIYYQLGTNIIKGLNYQLPTVNTGDPDGDYAIKRILRTIFNIRQVDWQDLMINDFIFHIVYRTKDTARSDQTRPDLRKYLLTSAYDKIPQHNQFNNQTDVVVDSTKFGNNIYGKLIRTGNSGYTKTEWVDSLTLTKHVGELYNINGELYYVATVTNTNYGTHIVSEITFSKDYNQLSEIIGIPSEPRFYEISERSIIDREKPFDNYIVLGTSANLPDISIYEPQSFVRENGWYYIRRLLFTNEANFPKYAITVFKNDEDRKYGTVKSNELFYKEVCHPISAYSIENTLTLEWDMVDNFSAGDKVGVIQNPQVASGVNPADKAYRTLRPVQYTDAYGRSDLVDFMIVSDLDGIVTNDTILDLPESPIRTKLTMCRTYVGKKTFTDTISKPALTQFVRDTLGREPQEGDGVACIINHTIDGTTTYSFCTYLAQTNGWDTPTTTEYIINQIDNGEIDFNHEGFGENYSKYLFGNENVSAMGYNSYGLGLLKDARETIHFNYNLQMITDSDRFVLSSWLWQPSKGTLKIALLNKEINKISNDTIQQDDIITDAYMLSTDIYTDTVNGKITIPIHTILNGVDLTDVKAIAIVSDNIVAEDASSGARYFVMGRNIGGLDTSDITGSLTPEQAKEKAKADWYISNYDKSMFPHQ